MQACGRTIERLGGESAVELHRCRETRVPEDAVHCARWDRV
jgi:hypothetical protein